MTGDNVTSAASNFPSRVWDRDDDGLPVCDCCNEPSHSLLECAAGGWLCESCRQENARDAQVGDGEVREATYDDPKYRP